MSNYLLHTDVKIHIHCNKTQGSCATAIKSMQASGLRYFRCHCWHYRVSW